MATVLLAAAATAAQSASFALAAGANTTLTPVPVGTAAPSMAETAWCYIEKQDAGGNWRVEGSALTLPGSAIVLDAVGTYRINRPLQTNSIGVDRD
jgi:hypothetical protein